MAFGRCPKHVCNKIVGGWGWCDAKAYRREWVREKGGLMGNMLRRGESSLLCVTYWSFASFGRYEIS